MIGRYELKYPADAEQAQVARVWAQTFCEPDRFGDGGRYEVYSLYLDTREDRLVTSTLEGICDRFKVRVRSYALDCDGPLFLEIKRRTGRTIIKERARATAAEARALLAGESIALGPAAAGLTFRLLVDQLDLRPRVWVKYVREAFTSPYGDGARLTVDWRIEAQLPSIEDPLRPRADGWTRVPTERPQLIELKFNGAFPAWMDRLVRSARLSRRSFSKYTRAALAVPRGRELAWTR